MLTMMMWTDAGSKVSATAGTTPDCSGSDAAPGGRCSLKTTAGWCPGSTEKEGGSNSAVKTSGSGGGVVVTSCLGVPTSAACFGDQLGSTVVVWRLTALLSSVPAGGAPLLLLSTAPPSPPSCEMSSFGGCGSKLGNGGNGMVSPLDGMDSKRGISKSLTS